MGLILSATIPGFLAGLIGGLGLGGGGVLVMFLTVFAGTPQLEAQGINLLFFIPVGFLALLFHIRQKLIDFKTALPAIGLGLAGAVCGSMLTRFIGGDCVQILFGVMLAALGLWEVAAPHKTKENP
jgi:uncharacterized membrane protein YfcA